LIDTDVMIDAGRGLSAAVTLLQQQQAVSGIRISVITAMELIRGCRHARELTVVQSAVASFTVLPITPAISQRAHQLVAAFYLSHAMSIPDALIAGTALEHTVPLYSRNVRHFQMIPGLVITPPY
jgi:hypothetical protein